MLGGFRSVYRRPFHLTEPLWAQTMDFIRYFFGQDVSVVTAHRSVQTRQDQRTLSSAGEQMLHDVFKNIKFLGLNNILTERCKTSIFWPFNSINSYIQGKEWSFLAFYNYCNLKKEMILQYLQKG